MRLLMRVLAVAAVLLLAACGDATVDLDEDTAAVVDSVESEISRVGDEFEGAAVEAELAAAWEELEAELRATVDAVRTGADVDVDAVRNELDQFQTEIENSEIADDVRQAWSALQAQLEQLLTQIG